ncbi:MAG TPA: hypothetical protein PLJ47_14050 [Candidatus Hydrogenedentes bacterium]|nr:hypothetical protein [Candidatus Hydrogenedentota bacterium]HRK35714.1 hypothetical protein [Candidatus Hydrogenedentota bacterium]
MIRYLTLFVILVGLSASAQQSAYQLYTAQIEALQRDGEHIVREFGRDALIDRYRALIDANPGLANNIQLETQIAMLYESDFSDRGEPPNYQAAYETYQQIVENYDPSHPYMLTVRKLTAKSAVDLDPDAARSLYEDIITDYPEEDAAVVESHYALAKLAESQGDTESAMHHYNQVLGYTPSGEPMSEAELARIDAFQTNTIANALTSAIKGHNTPQDRMKALKKYVEKHQDMLAAHADLVQRFAQSVGGGSGADSDNQAGAASLEGVLASLKKNLKEVQEPRKDRSRVRELREQSTSERKVADASASTSPMQTALAAGNYPVHPEGTLTGEDDRGSAAKTSATFRLTVMLAAVAVMGLGSFLVVLARRASH